MPDGSEKQPVRLGSLAKGAPKKYAVDTAKKGLDACRPVPIAQLPASLWHMNPTRMAELKKSTEDSDRETVAAWNEWQLAYSSSITENGNRLRGALWCYRELSKHTDCAELKEKVRALLGQEWGVYAIPEDRCECDQIARETAQSMARVETRRWEDRA